MYPGKNRIAVLWWCLRLGYITAEMISRTVFIHISTEHRMKSARNTVSAMCRAGLLKRFQAAGFSGGPVSVFYLSSRGINVLTRSSGVVRSDLFPSTKKLHSTSVSHRLMLNTCIVRLYEFCFRSGIGFDFIPEFSPFHKETLNGRYIADTAPNPDSSIDEIGFVPDAVLYMDTGSKLWFLEIDMGSETIVSYKSRKDDIRTRFKAYLGYYAAGKFSRYDHDFNYRFSGFALLFLTTQKKRIARIADELMIPGFIWITSFERFLGNSIGSVDWTVPPCKNKKRFQW